MAPHLPAISSHLYPPTTLVLSPLSPSLAVPHSLLTLFIPPCPQFLLTLVLLSSLSHHPYHLPLLTSSSGVHYPAVSSHPLYPLYPPYPPHLSPYHPCPVTLVPFPSFRPLLASTVAQSLLTPLIPFITLFPPLALSPPHYPPVCVPMSLTMRSWIVPVSVLGTASRNNAIRRSIHVTSQKNESMQPRFPTRSFFLPSLIPHYLGRPGLILSP